MAGSFGDWFGTLKNVFKIGKGSLDTSAMTAARTLTFRDLSGTVALTSDGGAIYSESAQTVSGSPQTVFTVPSYTPGSKTLAVYRNGLRLTLTSDYTETNSTTVTLTSAAAVGDDMLFTIGAPTGSFGTMATQNASSVAITGGTATLSTLSTSGLTSVATGSRLLVGGVTDDAINSVQAPGPVKAVADGAGAFKGYGVTAGGSFVGYGSGGTVTSPTATSSGNTIGFFGAKGYVGAGGGSDSYSVNAAAMIRFAATENFTSSANGAEIRFETIPNGSTSRSERARVTNSGRILLNTTTDNGTDQLQVSGNIATVAAGNGLKVKEGSNAKQGTATLTAGAVTVSNTSVTANSRIFLTSQADGGTPGFLRVSARTAGTSFTITSSSGTDTSTVAYEIFEPA